MGTGNPLAGEALSSSNQKNGRNIVRLSLSPKRGLIRRLRFQLLFSVTLHAHGAVGTGCLQKQRMGDVRL